ncbi:hypothetical protein CR513_62934, partial [Mucuna pruriens]
MISTPASIEYIEGNEEASETSFQSLEIAGTEHKGDSKTTKAMFAIVKVLMKVGYQLGKGLRKSLNGIAEPITLQENPRKAGLGFYSQGHPKKARETIKITSDLTSPSTHNDNAILGLDESSEQNNQDQGQDEKVPALAELEKDLEHPSSMMQPLEESTKVVDIGMGEIVKEVKIGKHMSSEIRTTIIELLNEYIDIFVWSYHDIPGLDTNIVEHKLPIIPGATPIRQQLRRMKPEVALKIKEEVEKQWNPSFLAVVEYPQWVDNIVSVPKKDGKVCMCMDYRDLNRASPKDNFPLPYIGVLVDNTMRHQIFSFMDGFSGYNQIQMAPEDREKTTFITA